MAVIYSIICNVCVFNFCIKNSDLGVEQNEPDVHFPTDSLLQHHEHEAYTQIPIMPYRVCRDKLMFEERNGCFQLAAPEKMSWRR